MILSAHGLTTLQSCARRYVLESALAIRRLPPRYHYTQLLRAGVLTLSSGGDPAKAIATARHALLAVAARPGLDLPHGTDPYVVASDWCAILATTLTAISRLTLLQVQRLTQIQLSPECSWRSSSFSDDSGTLHRWIAVSEWDDSALVRAAHSWSVMADMAAYDAPLTLHAVVVGSRRGGRQHSPWCRTMKHPILAGRYRFQRKDDKGGWRALSGEGWTPTYLADLPPAAVPPDRWVDLLVADGVMPRLIHHQPIAGLSVRARNEVMRQILQESERARRLLDPVGTRGATLVASSAQAAAPTLAAAAALPMSRGACDSPGRECPWQPLCYGPDGTLAVASALGDLYRILPAGPQESTVPPPRPVDDAVSPRSRDNAPSPIAAS